MKTRVAVRKNGVLSHFMGNAVCILFFSASVFAQTPRKEPFPFDWMRPDAAPSTRTLSPKVIPTPQVIPEPAPVEEPTAVVETTPIGPQVEPAPDDSAPQGNIVPAPPASPHVNARQKPKPILNEIELTNARILTLVEFKLVGGKEEMKPLVIKPELQSGKSIKVEVPIVMGCAFTVWLEFTDGTPEQHEGVNLCNDKKINLVE